MMMQERSVDIGLIAATIAIVLLILVVFLAKSSHKKHALQLYESSHPIRPSQLRPAIGRAYLPSDPHIIPREASNLEEFLLELKPALDAHQLSFRPVHLIFNDSFYFTDIPHPACQGLWLEFGVFTGSTLNLTAEFRERHCGPTAGPVYGFDTFTGLPENWAGGFVQGAFSLEGDLPHVRHNIELVKGLFSDSLPPWMQAQRDANMGEFPPVTYLHIDCDLYAGARDALTLLKEHISPGCVLIFDELLHYQGYKKHEVKALWEYLQSSGRQLSVIGVKGPISQMQPLEAVDLNVEVHNQASWEYQSVAFLVL